jgi:uncharacterized protein YcbK (DUF882 family)
MGDLSKHFSRWEVTCRCGCGFNTMDIITNGWLELLRSHFNRKVTINSGCRCKAYNDSIAGSSPNSQHIYGRACDVVVDGITPVQVYAYMLTIMFDKGGLILYDNFVHIDSRSHETYRADKRKVK